MGNRGRYRGLLVALALGVFAVVLLLLLRNPNRVDAPRPPSRSPTDTRHTRSVRSSDLPSATSSGATQATDASAAATQTERTPTASNRESRGAPRSAAPRRDNFTSEQDLSSAGGRSSGAPPVRAFAARNAEAVVRTASGSIRLEPDAAGDFPQVVAAPGGTAEVSVVYADAEGPRETILQAEDGGVFPGGGIVRIAPLDDRNAIRFSFVASAQRGHHRVTLRRGADVKAFDFWVETGTEQGGTP